MWLGLRGLIPYIYEELHVITEGILEKWYKIFIPSEGLIEV
ncbi:MAG: hypothetical protein QW113_00020 [Candidatus Bathyarchaeia archaeon]